MTTINSDIVLDICAKECGSKCCDFYLNDFYARVNIEDYKRLAKNNLEGFVTWDHGDPQLLKQPGGECVFLHPDTKQCSIYPLRPLDCRNFPYFMPEENIPDHCLLYYRSSDHLIKQEKAKTHDVPEFSKSYDELTSEELEYIHNLQNQPSLDLDHLTREEFLITTTSYVSVIYSSKHSLEKAKDLVTFYQKQIRGKQTYRVLSIVGLRHMPKKEGNKFHKDFHILGIIRSSSDTVIDRMDNFPTSLEQVEEILDYVNENDYLKLVGGFEMDNSTYQYLENLSSGQ